MEQLVNALKKLDRDQVLELVRRQNDSGADPLDILADLQEGMRQVGEEFEKGVYYLSELIMSSAVFKQAVEIINERLTDAAVAPKYGTFVLGTVKDDIHDIGKDIVATLLSCRASTWWTWAWTCRPKPSSRPSKKTIPAWWACPAC